LIACLRTTIPATAAELCGIANVVGSKGELATLPFMLDFSGDHLMD